MNFFIDQGKITLSGKIGEKIFGIFRHFCIDWKCVNNYYI
jgi:hypothetical protein